MSDYEERYQRSRDEEREYEADVYYEVWRAGGDPDRIDTDRVNDSYWDSRDVESATKVELREQKPREHQMEEDYNA